jgi:hypothetical protein
MIRSVAYYWPVNDTILPAIHPYIVPGNKPDRQIINIK